MIYIKLAEVFSKTPGGRFRREGPFSGEQCLEEIIEPAFIKSVTYPSRLVHGCPLIVVDLDGSYGYGVGFLDQVFGGLARKYGAARVENVIRIISKEEPYLIGEIQSFWKEARILEETTP